MLYGHAPDQEKKSRGDSTQERRRRPYMTPRVATIDMMRLEGLFAQGMEMEL